MIVQNDMVAIKSSEKVIRSVSFEFNHFTIDQMDILKDIISNYLETNRAVFTKGKFCVMKTNNDFINKHLVGEGVRIYDDLFPVLDIELHLWGKPNKQCILYVKAPLNLDRISPKHIRQCIIKITRKRSEDIYFRLNKIDNVETKSNYFIQDIGIWEGDFCGQYDFGAIRVDFGYPNPTRLGYKVARCFIRYKQYKIDMMHQPIFSFIVRENKIHLTLLQCFLRFSIYELPGEYIFLPSDIFGKSFTVDRTDIDRDYISDMINNRVVPDDVSELFIKYEQLSEIEKNIFFNAVCSYCEGIKQEGAKAVSYYVICLETLAAYEAKNVGKTNINKIDMIYEFLQSIYSKSTLSHKSIEDLYSVRSAYVHNGIANNDFLDEIFMKSYITNSYCEIMERITNYTLIIWLKRM